MRKASTPTAAKPANHQATDNKGRLNQVLAIGLSTLSLNNESVGAPADKRKLEAAEEPPQAKLLGYEYNEADFLGDKVSPDVFQMDREELDKKIERAKKEGLDEGYQKGLDEGYQKGLDEGYQKGKQEGYEQGKQEGRQAVFAEIQVD